MVQVSTEENGRYTEVLIDGVRDGSVAYDEETNQLVVNGEIESVNSHVSITLPEQWDE